MLMETKPSYKDLEKQIKKLTKAASENKKIIKASMENEARYRQILNIAPAGIYEVDFRTGKFVNVNDTISDYSGYTKEELLSMNAIDILTEESQKKLIERTAKMLNGEMVPEIVDYEIIRKDGSLVWLNISNRFVYDDGNIVGSTVVARDITEYKRIQNELIESEKKFRTLVNTAPYGIQLTDRAGKIIVSNPAHHAILGYTDGQLIGKYVWELVVEDPQKTRTKKDYANLIKHEPAPEIYYNKNETKDGRVVDVQINWNYVRDINGNVDGIVSVIHDITQRKRTEKALRERDEALRAKASQLQEVNTTLKVLLKKRDEDKVIFQKQVMASINSLILPCVDTLRKTNLSDKQKKCVEMIDESINEIVSPFAQQVGLPLTGLTPTEIRVANLIRQGKKTKEIATLLDLSPRTIDSHRRSIRKKLGISKKNENLRSHLLSLSGSRNNL